eukprot:g12903.t1
MRISAFVLVCGNVLADVGLFCLALVFLILMFATAISSLNHHVVGFDGVGPWLVGLLQITLGMFPPTKSDTPVLIAVSVFVAVLSIFLVNLLVAQLNQSYRDIFEDMQGFARLTPGPSENSCDRGPVAEVKAELHGSNRAGVTADIIEQVSRKRWVKFTGHLRFDDPLERGKNRVDVFEAEKEFNEGDVGVPGGIQILEPANANMTACGKRCAPSTGEDDRFVRLEKLIMKATRKPKSGGKSHKTPSAMDASDLGESEEGSLRRGTSQ